jgi:hypothetical protein
MILLCLVCCVQTCAISREGLYAAGYLGLFPVIQAALIDRVSGGGEAAAGFIIQPTPKEGQREGPPLRSITFKAKSSAIMLQHLRQHVRHHSRQHLRQHSKQHNRQHSTQHSRRHSRQHSRQHSKQHNRQYSWQHNRQHSTQHSRRHSWQQNAEQREFATRRLLLPRLLFSDWCRALCSQGYSPSMSLVLAGLLGGTFGAAASHPFDTAKTRMQVRG